MKDPIEADYKAGQILHSAWYNALRVIAPPFELIGHFDRLRWIKTAKVNNATPHPPAQEPVGKVVEAVEGAFRCEFTEPLPAGTKLYTAPPLPVQAEQEPVTWSARAADVQEVCAKIEKYGLMMGEGDVGPYIAWMLKSLNALADAASLQPEERNFCPRCGKRTADLTTIHTCTPPQRKWVNLTVDELIDLEHKHLSHENLTRAIEAKLKEKNT